MARPHHVVLEGPVGLKAVDSADPEEEVLEDLVAPLGLELVGGFAFLGEVGKGKVDPERSESMT